MQAHCRRSGLCPSARASARLPLSHSLSARPAIQVVSRSSAATAGEPVNAHHQQQSEAWSRQADSGVASTSHTETQLANQHIGLGTGLAPFQSRLQVLSHSFAQQAKRKLKRVLGARMLAATRRLQRTYSSSVLTSEGLLLAAAFVAPTVPGNGISDLLTNRVFLVGFWAWFMAQFAKIFTKRYKKGVWDLRAMVDSGGMPSSHSSLCAGITTAVAMQQGFGSPLFAACLCFSVIVMYDAMGVRRHAGKQAEVLNRVINELLEDHPVGEIKLKEVLGHTPRQVVCGALLGLATGLFYPNP